MNENYYNEMIKRNIGIFTVEEQAKIKKMTIGVAGLGGVGGIASERLVRMGIGKIKISDNDNFDKSNLNRQFGSSMSTLGKNKSNVIANILRDINPSIEIKIYDKGINNRTVKSFTQDCDFVIDGIDYNIFKSSLLLHDECRKKKIFVLNPHAIGFGTSILIFDPKGVSFQNYVGIQKETNIETFILPPQKFCPIIPSYIPKNVIDKVINKEMYIPTVSVGPAIAGSLAAMITILFLLGKRDFPIVPNILYMDLFDRKIFEK